MKNIIYTLLGTNKIKNNKFYFLCKIVLSLIFAFTIMLDSMLVFQGQIYGTLEQIHFTQLELKNILIFILSVFVTYIALSIFEIIVDKLEKAIYTQKQRKTQNIKVYFIVFLVILIAWLPYILSYFPGGIYADTMDAIRQITGEKPWNNNNPILYTFILKIFVSIGNSMQLGFELFTIAQVLAMACVIAYLIYWLYKKNVSIKYLVLVTFYFAIFSLIPIYAISIWKDTPFCIALLLYIILIAETIYQDGKNLEKKSTIIQYLILMILVCSLRNNGIYIIVTTTIILAIIYRKRITNKLKAFCIVQALGIITIYIIQGPIYAKCGFESKFIGSLGIPLQQMYYVIADNGNITEEQKDFFENVYSIEKIKERYNPCIVDKINWATGFNYTYIEEHRKEVINIWFDMFLKNPKSYVKAYLLNTIGFWDITKATTDGYINPQMWNEDLKNIYNIEQIDYIEKLTGQSIKSIITPSAPISSAVFGFVAIFGCVLTIYKKRYKNLLIYLPAILTWATVLIAAPLAFSLRYVYILVLILPLGLILPILNQEHRKN